MYDGKRHLGNVRAAMLFLGNRTDGRLTAYTLEWERRYYRWFCYGYRKVRGTVHKIYIGESGVPAVVNFLLMQIDLHLPLNRRKQLWTKVLLWGLRGVSENVVEVAWPAIRSEVFRLLGQNGFRKIKEDEDFLARYLRIVVNALKATPASHRSFSGRKVQRTPQSRTRRDPLPVAPVCDGFKDPKHGGINEEPFKSP